MFCPKTLTWNVWTCLSAGWQNVNENTEEWGSNILTLSIKGGKILTFLAVNYYIQFGQGFHGA